MRTSIGLLFLFFFLGVSCSKNDDAVTEEAVKIEDISFQAIGLDTQAIYQYSYDGAQDTEETVNLSTELGLGSEYLTLRQLGKTLSFYTFSQGKFSLLQKNVSTGAVQTYIDFYTNSSARSIVWGVNNEESVFFGYFNPQGSTNLAIQNVALDNFQGSDLSLEFNIEQLYQPLYHNGKLFITYKNSASEYKISIYDTDSYALIQTIGYGAVSPSILIDDNGNLAVFKFGDGSNISLEIRDIDNFMVLEQFEFELNHRFGTGPINAIVKDKMLFYEYEYLQPFDIDTGPAVLDFDTGENRILDLVGTINEIEALEDISTYVVWQQYDSVEDVFLVSYGTFSDSPILEGGVIVLSPKGALLKNIDLPFVPTYFVK